MDLPKCGCLLIDSKVLEIPDHRHPRIFDPLEDHFNPFVDIDYRKCCDILDTFDAIFDKAGATTLTKEAGLEYIADILFDPEHPERSPKNFIELLERIGEPDKKSLPGHIWAYSKVRRILRSPILRDVFCERPNFTFKRGSVNQARIDRAELGPFDANVLGLFLIAQFKGQIVIPHYAPYARPMHISLIEENRLIAGVRTLSQLKERSQELHDIVLTVETIPRQCNYADAVTLAENAGERPDPLRQNNDYDDYINEAMAGA